jgi:hypothetical protein
MRAFWMAVAVMAASVSAYAGSFVVLEFGLGVTGQRYLTGAPGEVVSTFYAPLRVTRHAGDSFENAVNHAERSGWELRCRARSTRLTWSSGRLKLSSTGPALTYGCMPEWYCP